MPIDYGADSTPTTPSSAQQPWRLFGSLLTNSAALTAATAKAPSLTRPATSSTRWVFGVPPSMALLLAMYGTDAANETVDFSVWGWREVWSPTSEAKLWTPHLLLTVTAATLGARVGLSGGIVTNLHFFADAYPVAVDNTPGDSAEAVFDSAEGIAALWMDAAGHSIVEVEARVATAASVGGMWATA